MANSIELRHLRYFVALAEELHFGRAAKRCNVTQPPFSVSIQQLENELGFALAERSSHSVRLTAAGNAFYEEAGKALSQIRHASDLAARVNGGLHGVVKVGFFASMLDRGLDRAVKRFETAFPWVDVQLFELNTADQFLALQRREIQYGFVHGELLPAGLTSRELLREPFVLCLPASHRYADQPNLSLADMRDEPFIVFARAFSPAYYDQVVSLCVVAGFHPNIRYELRHWLTVVSCVSKGMGITVMPRSLAHAGFRGLKYVDIGTGSITSIVRGAWRQSDDGNSILRNWRNVVEQEYSSPADADRG